jgi:hypothetical protein
MRSEGCRVCSMTLPDALFVKVVYKVTLYSKYTRALTFENF